MLKALETAIDKIQRLPVERQAYAARLLDELAREDGEPFSVPDDHRAAICEALDQLKDGERAAPAEVDKLLRRPWA